MKVLGTILLALTSLLALPAAGDDAPTARDQHGKEHAWRGASGRLTVLDFAATWCEPCRRTLPRLQAFAERHPELRVLVVSVDVEVEGRDELVADLGLKLPVLWDEDYAIADHYSPTGMPTTVVLDPEGTEVHRHTGSKEDDWRAFVDFVEERLAGDPRDRRRDGRRRDR